MVVYQALYGDYSMYCRPLAMFLSEVDKEKYPEVTCKYRFTKIDRATLCDKISNSSEKETLKEQTQPKEQDQLQWKAELINADLMAFLDAKDYGEKLEVLYSIRKRIDDRIMSDIEMSLDLPVGSGEIEKRVELVRNNLHTMNKFEGRRLR
jgi:hypothetical protein